MANRTPGLVTLTPIEAMRQDRKKIMAKLETLSAENARLREELEHLISIFGCQNAVNPGDDLYGDCKACSVCIARSALAIGGGW